MAKKPAKRIGDNLYALSNSIYRVSGPESGLCAYLVETSAGFIQVNAAPEFFKSYFPHLKQLPVAVCLTAPVINQLGDTLTGFEFELWTSRFMDFMHPHKIKFIGHEAHIQPLYKRLEITMNGDFVKDESGNAQAKFVARRWVDEVFEWCPTSGEFDIDAVRIDLTDPTSVKIYDKQKLVFDSDMYPTVLDRDAASLYVDTVISQIEPFNPNGEFGVIVGGTGIGSKPGITSNFIFHYADRLIWIDPPARFFEKAVSLHVNPDSVTDFIISHCHEDHIEGFSALLQRKIEQSLPLRLLSTPLIYEQLQSIFNPIFGDIAPHIDFADLSDRLTFSSYHGCDIDIRENYHPVPTIGFKLTYEGKIIGISGDVLYSRSIVDARLKSGMIDKEMHDKLSPVWYGDAKFFLHDTTVTNDPVHTALQHVEQFSQEIPHVKAYGYHAGVTEFNSRIITAAIAGDRLQ